MFKDQPQWSSNMKVKILRKNNVVVPTGFEPVFKP
jgi:hypothetical protein